MSNAHVHPAFRGVLDKLSGSPRANPAAVAHLQRMADATALDDRVRSRFSEPARALLNAGLDLARLATRLGAGEADIGPVGGTSDLAIRAAIVRYEAAQGALFHAMLEEAGSADTEAASTEDLRHLLGQTLRANEAGLPDLDADARRTLRAGAGY